MIRKQIVKIFMVAAISLTLHNPSYSQEGESGDGGESADSGESDEIDSRQPAVETLSDRDTVNITNSISNKSSVCLSLPKEYRADCLAQNLKDSSRVVRKSGYRGANNALSSGARRISRLVRQNEDKTAPKIRRGGKTYRAVKKSAVAKVNRQAARIVTETKTKLLRSAGRSAAKKIHYARIAKVVDSTKVLLRS